METECNAFSFEFQPLGSRQVTARFDGGRVSSDGGGILLRELERRFGFLEKLADCFTDHRDPDQIEHTLLELLKQRVFGLCLGYEDLNDHDALRRDPLLALLVGKEDPLGETRDHLRDRGKALAGKSTLNRLELSPPKATSKSRYKKIVADVRKLHAFLVEAFLDQHAAHRARSGRHRRSSAWPSTGALLSRLLRQLLLPAVVHLLWQEIFEQAYRNLTAWQTTRLDPG